MLHRVLKSLTGPNGKVYNPGDTVDTSGWVWEKHLREQKKIRPLYEEQAEPAPPMCAAKFAAHRLAGSRKKTNLPPPRKAKAKHAEGQPTA